MVTLLLLSLLVGSRSALGCWTNDLYFGNVRDTPPLATVTISSGGGTCTCCALCHQVVGCRGFYHRVGTPQCTLYPVVGALANFTVTGDGADRFHFLHGLSESGEFCREDSDCVAAGDRCAARHCTTLDTVTCLTLQRLNPSLPTGHYWLAFSRQEYLVHCAMTHESGGYTRLMRYEHSSPFNADNFQDTYSLRRSDGRYALYPPFSLLRWADVVRDQGSTASYSIYIMGTRRVSECLVPFNDTHPCPRAQKRRWNEYSTVQWDAVERGYSILGSAAAVTPFQAAGDRGFSLPGGGAATSQPYLPADAAAGRFVSIGTGGDGYGTVSSDGAAAWKFSAEMPHPHIIQLYIREDIN